MMSLLQHKHNLHVISYIIIIALSLIFQQCEETSSPSELSLAAPSNLQMEILSTGSVKITWVSNSKGEQGFQIERKLGSSGIFKALASVDNSRNFYIDSSAKSADSIYYYRIRPFYNYQFGDYSPETPLILSFAPPANVKIVSDASDLFAVNIAWTDTVSNEQGFQIERKAENGAFVVVSRVGKNASAFSDSTILIGDTKYSYRVRSFGPGIVSAPSNEVELIPAFARPSGLSVVFVEDSLANLQWTANNAQRTGFKIDYADTLKTYVKGDSIRSLSSNYSQKAAFKLNDKYSFRVYNFGGNRISKPSDSVLVEIKFRRPGVFKLSSVSEGNQKFTWIDSTAFEKAFEIEKREGATGTFTKFATLSPEAVTASVDSTLKTNIWYYFRVRAVTKKNNYSPYSNLDSVNIAFEAPTGLVFSEVSPTSVRLSWFDNSSIEDSFRIERTSLIDNKVTIFNAPANSSNITVNNDVSVPYLFKIRGLSPKKNLTAYANELRIANTASSLIEIKRVSDTAQVTCAVLDTAGQKLIVGYASGIIKVLDANSGNTIRTIFSDSTSKINSLDVSGNNNMVVAGYENGRVVIWDINTGAKSVSLVFPNACMTIAWAKKANLIGAGFSDGKSYLINPVTLVKTSLLPDHLGSVNSIGFGMLDTLVVTASSDSSVKVFRHLPTFRLESALPNSPSSPVLSAAFMTGTTRRLAYFDKIGNVKARTGSTDGSSYASASIITTHQSGNGLIGILDYSSLLSIGSDNLLKLIRYPSIGVVNTTTPHSSSVIGLTVSANRKYVALVAKDNTISIWKVDSHWEKQ